MNECRPSCRGRIVLVCSEPEKGPEKCCKQNPLLIREKRGTRPLLHQMPGEFPVTSRTRPPRRLGHLLVSEGKEDLQTTVRSTQGPCKHSGRTQNVVQIGQANSRTTLPSPPVHGLFPQAWMSRDTEGRAGGGVEGRSSIGMFRGGAFAWAL